MLEEETRNEFVTRMQLPLKMVTIRKKLIIREFDSKEDVGVFKLCKSFIVFRWMLLGSVFVSSFFSCRLTCYYCVSKRKSDCRRHSTLVCS